jgi:hypothetical protein
MALAQQARLKAQSFNIKKLYLGRVESLASDCDGQAIAW